jgi:hypothetical protein
MDRRIEVILLLILILAASSTWGTETSRLHPAELAALTTPVARSPANSFPQDVIVYTAHQEWLSRIYLLGMDGSVIDYFEYSFYYFADLEVVNNEVYAAEAFAPRVYRVDLHTGVLDLVIDDWSLYYFYDLAFDGTYFYLTEWDLNRYDVEGDKDGTASFDYSVHGGAWDGSYYWTLTDGNQIKCWDLSSWPNVSPAPENDFAPPTSSCRGLWFDGQYFWTAESKDGVLGQIYRFDHTGEIIDQWLEPAFMGWSACLVKASDYPQIPQAPSGPTEGETGVQYSYSATTTDPEEDSLFFWFDWGDGTGTGWLGPYCSGDTCTASKAWVNPGEFRLKVKAKDVNEYQSDWSETLNVIITARGDCNSDGLVDLADVIFILNYLFKGGPNPDPFWAGDANSDSTVDLADAVYLFRLGPPPH